MPADSVFTRLYPAGMLNTLSCDEVERLHGASRGNLAGLLKRCALAVLNSGNQGDDAEALLEKYRDFRIEVQQVNRGLRLELSNAPGSAFVDGQIIQGIRELLSAVIRDLVYFDSEISGRSSHNLEESSGITNAVFEMLRNAGTLLPAVDPDLVVCWGGHSIARTEYGLHQDLWLRTGFAPAEHNHRLRTRGNEGADERRHHCTCETTGLARPLHRYFRARNYSGRITQSNRQ